MSYVFIALNYHSFIEYFSNEDAERAVQELNGRRLGGKRVTVAGITVVNLFYPNRLSNDNVYSRCQQFYQRSRSRSPIRRRDDSRHRSPSGNKPSPLVLDPLHPNANIRYFRDSPPPSYAYRHAPALYQPAQHPPHYQSPAPPPLGQESNSLVQHNSTPRYVMHYGEELYGYDGDRLGRMDNHKYDYHDYVHDTARLWEDRTEPQRFDPFQHYQQ